MSATSVVELQAGAAAFLTYLRDVRQLSPHTLDNYRRDLRSLQQYCDSNSAGQMEDLIEADIRGWVSHLHRKGLAGSSIQRSLSAARSFFNYLGRESGRLRNPANAVQGTTQTSQAAKNHGH